MTTAEPLRQRGALSGWCGRCGGVFALLDVVRPTAAGAGRCPHCGALFAPGYTSLLLTEVRSLLDDDARATQEAVEAWAARLATIAPHLHVNLGKPAAGAVGR